MSTVTSVYSPATSYATYGAQGASQGNSASAQAQALVALGNALQSGSVSNAQAALASFQQGVASGSESEDLPPFPPNAQADEDYANLVSSVNSGDLSGAHAALTKLQIDLQQAHSSRHASTAVPVTTIDTSDAASSYETPGTSGNYLNVTV